MSRTEHARPSKIRTRRNVEDVTRTRQPRPNLRRRNTRQAFIAAALKGI